MAEKYQIESWNNHWIATYVNTMNDVANATDRSQKVAYAITLYRIALEIEKLWHDEAAQAKHLISTLGKSDLEISSILREQQRLGSALHE